MLRLTKCVHHVKSHQDNMPRHKKYEPLHFYVPTIKFHIDQGWSFLAACSKAGLTRTTNTRDMFKEPQLIYLREYYLQKKYGKTKRFRN